MRKSSAGQRSRMRVWFAPLFFLCWITNYAVPQHDAPACDPKRTHPAAGASIIRFGEIDEGVYMGSKPKTDADFRFLCSENIKTIVDLQFVPVLLLRPLRRFHR
jgi:hypothetical protein